MYAIGVAAGPMRAIFAKATMMMAGSIASALAARSVDRRVGQELLKVIAPLGVEASLRALEELSAGDAAQRAALSQQAGATGV